MKKATSIFLTLFMGVLASQCWADDTQLQEIKNLRKELANQNLEDTKKELETLKNQEKIFRDNKYNMGIAKHVSTAALVGSMAATGLNIRNLWLKIGIVSENKKRFLMSGAAAGVSGVSLLFFGVMEDSDAEVLGRLQIKRDALDKKLAKMEEELEKESTKSASAKSTIETLDEGAHN